MEKFLLLFLSLYFCCHGIHSQGFDREPEMPRTVGRVHVVSPGFMIEQKVINNSTIVLDVGYGISFIKIEPEIKSNVHFNPYLRAEQRFYTNINRRKLLQKRVESYSADYLAFQFQATFPGVSDSSWLSFGPIGGIQRKFWASGYYNLGIGLGIVNYNYISNISIIGDFSVGFTM